MAVLVQDYVYDQLAPGVLSVWRLLKPMRHIE